MDYLQNLYKQLDQHAHNTAVEILVPSLNRFIKFKLLTAKQHKDIISTVVDRANAGLSFNIVLNAIISENCLEKVTLLTSDKPSIGVALRVHSISPIFNDINIKDVLSTKLLEKPQKTEFTIYHDDQFLIQLNIPTLSQETAIYQETIKRSDNNSQNLKLMIGDVYIHEIVKYFTSIQFQNDGNKETVIFKDLKFDIQRNIIERLPATASTEVVILINQIKNESQDFLKTLEGKVIEVALDQQFFTV